MYDYLHHGHIEEICRAATKVMETLKVEGFATCYAMYRNLTETVSNLQPYWDYVRCTKEAQK